MIRTIKARVQEIENIEKVKLKLAHIKERAIRVNPRTMILVREGKDEVKAVEEFRRKQLEATSRDFKDQLQY